MVFPWDFYIILSDVDFINLKQYYLLKLFQLSQIAANRFSLLDRTFSRTIFNRFPPYVDLYPDYSLTMSLILLCISWRKALFSVTRCIIDLKIFYQWNEKIIQDFNVNIYIDCYGNDFLLLCSFKWHDPHIMNNLVNLVVFFRQSSLYVAPNKNSSIIILSNADS